MILAEWCLRVCVFVCVFVFVCVCVRGVRALAHGLKDTDEKGRPPVGLEPTISV